MVVLQPSTTLFGQGAATSPLATPEPRIYSVVVTLPHGHSVLVLVADPMLQVPSEKRTAVEWGVRCT